LHGFSMFSVTVLLIGTCFLLWLVMSAPVGHRTVRRLISIAASPEHLWSALYPFGADFGWNDAVTSVTALDGKSGRMVTSHTGRDGQPIERDFEITDEVPGEGFTLRFTNDTSLAQSFWENHVMTVKVARTADGGSVADIAETDRYRGIAFLVFRFFALRRLSVKLKRWAETGEYSSGGIFEHPSTQLGMAALSAILLWPFFGLHLHGLFLSVTLTVVVGLHELGHMAAFRLMGHRSARMIFLPLLGGIAMGGRPYDKHFEIGFSALMGAGFSAFPVAALMWFQMNAPNGMTPETINAVLTVILIGALFNLGNLMPVWKFDGGQVLRQIFRSGRSMAWAAFATLMLMATTGWAIGLPWRIMMAGGAIIAMISLMTAKNTIKPKNELVAMTDPERAMLGAGFVAVMAIHAFAIIWSVKALFCG
jgi:Zn-dependent protease